MYKTFLIIMIKLITTSQEMSILQNLLEKLLA